LSLGGIEESFNTKDIKDKDQFWQTMGTALKHDAMLGCSITVCIRFLFEFIKSFLIHINFQARSK
jgi:hypothetical protein